MYEFKSACNPGESAGHSSLPFLRMAGGALEAEAIRQIVDTGDDVFEGFLIDLGRSAKGIGDVPILDFIGMIEDGVAALATKIDDQVGGIPNIARDGLGGKGFGGVAVGFEDMERVGRNVAEGEETGAGGIEDVGGIAARNGFGDGAATGVAETEEEDAEAIASGHARIVAFISGREERRKNEDYTEVAEHAEIAEKRWKRLRV